MKSPFSPHEQPSLRLIIRSSGSGLSAFWLCMERGLTAKTENYLLPGNPEFPGNSRGDLIA